MNKHLRRIWIIVKAIIAIWTVLTLITFFLYLLPKVLEMEIVQKNIWMPYTFVIVVFFWSGYIGYWGAKQFKGFKKDEMKR